MRELPGEGQHLADALPGLIGVPQHPEHQGDVAQAGHPVIQSIQRSVAAVLLEIIECNALLKVGASGGQLAPPVQGVPKCMVGFHAERGILALFSQGEQVLGQLLGCVELRPRIMKYPYAIQHREELRDVSSLLAQHPRPGIGGPHVRGGPAFGGNQGWTQGNEESDFLPPPLRGLGQRSEKFACLREMADPLLMRTPARGSLRRTLEILHRPAEIPRPLKMQGQLRGQLPSRDPVPRLQPGAHPLMQLDTARCGYPFVHHGSIERMDETIAGRKCSVWPFFCAACLQQIALVNECGTLLFHGLYILFYACYDNGSRKLIPCRTGRLQHTLRLRVEPCDLVLNHEPQVLRHPLFQLLKRCSQLPVPLSLYEHSLSYPILHDIDYEQWIPISASIEDL